MNCKSDGPNVDVPSDGKPNAAKPLGNVPLNRYFLFFALAASGCLVDLCTKSWVFAWLGMPGQQTWWLVDGVFGFQTSLNEGALFGFGQGGVKWFALFSVVAFVGIVYWLFVLKAANDLLVTCSLGCITAGIFGNLYDRLGIHGLEWNYATELHQLGEPVFAVRDWILIMIGNRPWPNFNIADSLLVVGVGLLLIHGIFFDDSNRVKTADSAE